MNSYEGEFCLDGTGISGWACAKDTPDHLWVEVLVDGCVMGIARAELQKPKGCGFWIALPPAALESGTELHVRIANTTDYLGEPLNLAKAVNTPALQGELQMDRGLTLSGWVVDSLAPEDVLRVTAMVAGTSVAQALACERRYRPEQGDGHGFTLRLPVGLADGEEHEVEVRDARQRALPGSPVTICAWPENLADWLERTPRPDKNELALMTAILRRMETRVPGGCAAAGADYAAWKAAFPVPKPQGVARFSLAVPLVPASYAARLAASQKGVDCKPVAGPADYALLLREGESLHPCALAHMVAALRSTGAGLAYADSESATDHTPCFRPAWDADAFWAQDQLGPFVVTRDVWKAAPPADGETYWSYRVRLARAASGLGGVCHLPQVLSRDLPLPEDTGRSAAVQDWVASLHADAHVTEAAGRCRVRWPRAALPPVTVIIPTRDHADLLGPCLKSLSRSTYPEMEILLVDNGTAEAAALRLLHEAAQRPRTRVLSYPGPFNYAAINNIAVREAQGDLVCFLNNDTEAITPDWLQEMASLLTGQGDAVGCVGAKLLWPNGLVQHAGVVVGTHQLAAHIGNQWTAEEPGYLCCNQIVGQRSAVTAACLLTPKALFEDLGGFDARRFAVAFNDVDYCLRVRDRGKKILWTPFATLLHRESASRGVDTAPMNRARLQREMRFFRQQWGDYDDPFYNPNLPLSTVEEPFAGLALPPRARQPR